ncbi:hypothetical protein CHS0354_039506 [Potamilus streckersoni]|uniref:Noggin n=1 Tax=Potamilus streckersoni TaxID=2493646 RepID=A0AAE0WGY6_9BIVA|nr:hypothetical protein CHS0354_039506 [Potamilus streckersoni]
MDFQRFLFLLSLWVSQRVEGSHSFLGLLKESDFGDSSPNSLSHRGNIRPSPSDELPVSNIIENPDKRLDPPDEDMNYNSLRRILGKHYDKNFMSVVRPIESIIKPNGTMVYKKRKGRPMGRKPDYIKKIGSPIKYGGDARASGLIVGRKTKKKLQKYIWNYTHCPVSHVWRDLGIRFWPQWIREGSCSQGRSCSIPPGMQCRASQSAKKTILRWHCRQSTEGKINCKWIPIQYPIITECSCAC